MQKFAQLASHIEWDEEEQKFNLQELKQHCTAQTLNDSPDKQRLCTISRSRESAAIARNGATSAL